MASSHSTRRPSSGDSIGATRSVEAPEAEVLSPQDEAALIIIRLSYKLKLRITNWNTMLYIFKHGQCSFLDLEFNTGCIQSLSILDGLMQDVRHEKE